MQQKIRRKNKCDDNDDLIVVLEVIIIQIE